MWNDTDLQHYIEQELEWEPSVHKRQIGVIVKNGAAHLDGHVDSYWEKCVAESAAWRVAHIKSVANDIRVELPFSQQRDDDDLALAAMGVLEANCLVPGTVEVKVAAGTVTLIGHVEWHHQQEAAAQALMPLKGLRGLRNDIAVKPVLALSENKSLLEEALRRSALVDSNRIKVHIAHGVISLRGTARTQAERAAAMHAAWSTPGAAKVEDHLTIG